MAFHFTNISWNLLTRACFEFESILVGLVSSAQRTCCCLISDSLVNEYITNL